MGRADDGIGLLFRQKGLEPGHSAESADPFPGAFRLVRRLGQGAFGGVWLAEDLHLNRPVALKMILPAGPAAEAERRLDRLRGEARLLASVRHPNIIPVLAWQEGRAPAFELGELLEAYPDAKVLLSVRDPERWEPHFRATIPALCYGESPL